MDKKALNDLMLRIKGGDEDAFAAYYEATRRGVYAFILGYAKSPETAEDLMQDTYVRVRQAVQGYTSGNPVAWTLQIAKNLALNELYRKKRETSVDFSEFDVPDKVSVEERADTYVFDTLKRVLLPDEAQLVILHLINGLKHREIAEVTGKPLGTVLWAYNNSISKLKKALKEDGYER